MKKRIIAFILVLAMAFIALVGCAYNFAKDDMSKYASMKDTLDGATFAEPALAPEGIDYVIIGGEIAAKNCEIVNHNCGKAVRK